MAVLDFNHNLKQITVLIPDVKITIQEVYNKAKDEEDFTHIAMTTGTICTASGKENLGEGNFIGITMTMQNGWTLGFEERVVDTPVQVLDGNIVAVSGVVGEQFHFTPFTQILYQGSVSPTISVATVESGGGTANFRSMDF